MKVTGFQISNALRELYHVRDIAAATWADCQYAFAGENKPHPDDVALRFMDAEAKVAKLQVAQQHYNLTVRVSVQGQQMTLSEAVKRVGGAGRMEKMWRSYAVPKKDRYERGPEVVRNKDEVHAGRVIPTHAATDRARAASRFANALRSAIQIGNATEIEIDMDPELLQ